MISEALMQDTRFEALRRTVFRFIDAKQIVAVNGFASETVTGCSV